MKPSDEDSSFKELNRKMNIIINFFSDAVKSNLKTETVELWDLLKKTQSKVNSIESDIQRVENENIQQGQGFKDFIV